MESEFVQSPKKLPVSKPVLLAQKGKTKDKTKDKTRPVDDTVDDTTTKKKDKKDKHFPPPVT